MRVNRPRALRLDADVSCFRLCIQEETVIGHDDGFVKAHAAQLMQKVFALPKPVPHPVPQLKQTAEGFEEFSPAVVGKRYKQRLKEIYAKRHDLNLAFSTAV